ncbi:MAG: hypothetical protein PHS54_03360 [Clostridia bacterium]|nr:hypothetical protein [Clostridia bacterium]
MAAYYSENGSAFINDDIRDQLISDYQDLYDKLNQGKVWQSGTDHPRYVADKYEGNHLPGVYIKNLENSEYVFQFYPLHPLWMSLFGVVFGNGGMVWALTFFSLLSLIGAYLIAYELSGRRRLAGIILALLLAINPLHAFFSKFPVSEVPALAFTFLGFYYLLKFYNDSKEQKSNIFDLFFSSWMFFGLFFTRITGFMYIPFFLLIGFLSFFHSNSEIKKNIILYIVSVIALFMGSLFYGYFYSYPYFKDIFLISFSKLFDIVSLHMLVVICIGGLMMFVLAKFHLFKKLKERMIDFIEFIRKLLPYLFYSIIILGAYKAYIFAFTNATVMDSLNTRWQFAYQQWKSIGYTSLSVELTYLTIVGFLLLLIAVYSLGKSRKTTNNLLVVFLSMFWFYILFLQYRIPYQYYYARYHLSEVLPFSLLAVSIFLTAIWYRKKWGKYFVPVIVGIMCLFLLPITMVQFAGAENEGVHKPLGEIAEIVEDDILLVGKNISDSIVTSLKFYYELKVVKFSQDCDNNSESFAFIKSLSEINKGDIFYITTREINDSTLEFMNRMSFKSGLFEHGPRPPTKFLFHEMEDFFLYRIDVDNLNQSSELFRFYMEIANFDLEGFYSDKLWTKGDARIVDLDYKIKTDDTTVVIKLAGFHPYKNQPDKMGLRLLINDVPAEFIKADDKNFHYHLPENIETIQSIQIISATFIPKDLGINNDTRVLGVDVNAISIF